MARLCTRLCRVSSDIQWQRNTKDLRGRPVTAHGFVEGNEIGVEICLDVYVAVLVAGDAVDLAVTVGTHRTGDGVRLAGHAAGQGEGCLGGGQ